MAAQAVGLELQLQLLDAVFHVAPQHVDVVIDHLGVAAQVSDHEPLIGAQMSVSTFAMIRRDRVQDSA